MSYAGRGAAGQFLKWDGAKQVWADSVGLAPTAFSTLRAWWDIQNAPSDLSPANTLWPSLAGNQGVSLQAGTVVGRSGYTPFPGNIQGIGTGFATVGYVDVDTGNTPWVTADGSLTMFAVSRVQSGATGRALAGMGPLGNPNSGSSNFMRFAANEGQSLKSQKNSFAGNFTIVAPSTWTAREDMAFVVVSTYTATGLDTTVLFDDGLIVTGGGIDATTIALAGGFLLNRYAGNIAPQTWDKPTVSAGVIGQALTAGERLALARNLAARFQIAGF